MLSAAGGPCAWLSLCVSRDTTTAALCLATSYVVSMAAAPTALYIICGFAPTPALGQSIWPALCTLPPFIGGVLYTRLLHKYNIQCENIGMHQKTMDPICEKLCEHELRDCPHQLPDCTQTCASVAKICALVLLYFDCCERLWDVEGSLHIVHVLGTMTFAVVYVCLSAVSWCVYARGGLAGSSARTLAVCAVPKALHTGWEAPAACAARGAGRLAAAFVAPAQALLVAALAAPR
ncbi:unnamed protein product [Diatraea saccharalis]|uniref:Uncharacterized protein n=1 Tax=Diatraea saccharalis TaxID=40085 RepID=A0A9N9RC04_9NEOP|nr:unnamed protein product [Diatraea saccharalis]